MALKYAPRVKETTTTTGTGTYSLGGAVIGFQSFVSGINTANKTCYSCTNQIDWEIGVGTVTDSTTDTLSRDTIIASSNSGSAVNWGAGSKDIFCTVPPELFNYLKGHTTGAFEQMAASGFYSLGNNTLTGVTEGSAVIGNGNTVAANNSYVIGGSNVVASVRAAILGSQNEVDTNSCYVLGEYNYSEYAANGSFAIGNYSANRYVPGAIILSTNFLGAPNGAFQTQVYNVGVYTTDATTTGLGREFGESNEFKQGMLIAAGHATASLLYDILVLARQVGGTEGLVGDSKAWRLQAMVLESAGTLTQVGSTTTTNIAASTDASTWTAVLDVSEIFPIRVTGQTDKQILWTAHIVILEASAGYST